MSLFLPDLERELRRAIRADAHRPGHNATAPRRQRGSLIAITASVLVALMVVAIAIRAGGIQHSAGPSRAPLRSGSPYAALRRTRTSADAMPAATLRLLRDAIRQEHANPSASRRVFASGAETIWLLPASVHGKPAVCIFAKQGFAIGGGCEPEIGPAGILLLTMGGLHVEAVLTSRATGLRVTLKNGRSYTSTSNPDGAIVRTFPEPIRHTAFVTP